MAAKSKPKAVGFRLISARVGANNTSDDMPASGRGDRKAHFHATMATHGQTWPLFSPDNTRRNRLALLVEPFNPRTSLQHHA